MSHRFVISAFALLLALVALSAAGRVQADTCRSVDVQFKPVANLQIAVWIEDTQGHYVDTAYVTRLTGSLGLANRPGNHLFKTDYRFPYGRRDMVLPVWAHTRNHPYGWVTMGGAEGNSVSSCVAHGGANTDCNDDSIGYHFGVSSPEPFYCSPQGGVTTKVNGVDVISCASSFYGSKGAYASAPSPTVSLYPPRADLTSFVTGHDGADAMAYVSKNDLGAISGATPTGGALIAPIRWTTTADGNYVLKVEMSLESDFNGTWTSTYKQPFNDVNSELNGFGHNFLGQPSVVYAVPFTVGDSGAIAQTGKYSGYGSWDGSSGTLYAPDATISDSPGTGAGRLLDVTDGNGTWRVLVHSNPNCDTSVDGGVVDGGQLDGSTSCASPLPVVGLTATPHATSVDLTFASATSGQPTTSFEVRYSSSPITDANFESAIPASMAPPAVGTLGSTVLTSITGFHSQESYYAGVRAHSTCGAASPVATVSFTTTTAQFATLHGCFIATAAYGTPQAKEIDVLRRLRDQRLLPTPLGRLAVAAYYSLSPPVANAITTDEHLRAGARALVQPLVDLASAAERAQSAATRLIRK